MSVQCIMLDRTSIARSLAGPDTASDTPAHRIRADDVASDDSARGRADGAASSRADFAIPMASNDEATARRFEEAVMPHLDDAYNLARYLTRNSQDAEDVVQDAYLRAFRFFDTLKGSNARPWLLAIVRNCFYSWLKTRSRGAESLGEIDLDTLDAASAASDFWVSDSPDPEKVLIKLDDATAVRKLIEELPVPFREALVLREMEELSYQDIAEIMGAPIGTVMSRLARARQLFKAAWLDHQEKERR